MLILRCDSCQAIHYYAKGADVEHCPCGESALHTMRPGAIVPSGSQIYYFCGPTKELFTRDDKDFLRSLKIRPEDDVVADEWAL